MSTHSIAQERPENSEIARLNGSAGLPQARPEWELQVEIIPLIYHHDDNSINTALQVTKG